MEIIIKSGSLSWKADIFDTLTGRLIWKALPLKGRASRWGDEIYFTVPVSADLESDASETVSMGDLGYWPTGRAFCIFFGPTPVSTEGEIRAAGAVNVFGRVEGDLSRFGMVIDGDEVVIEGVDHSSQE